MEWPAETLLYRLLLQLLLPIPLLHLLCSFAIYQAQFSLDALDYFLHNDFQIVDDLTTIQHVDFQITMPVSKWNNQLTHFVRSKNVHILDSTESLTITKKSNLPFTKNQGGGVNHHYVAAIKVLGGLVISKECSRWHKQTHKQTDIATYSLKI